MNKISGAIGRTVSGVYVDRFGMLITLHFEDGSFLTVRPGEYVAADQRWPTVEAELTTGEQEVAA